ncbi:hypothetical protein SNEBB_004628 [Seison nebaliae]|nr:hypothetical protein SNEBB_004628 [Seison nebaliae]
MERKKLPPPIPQRSNLTRHVVPPSLPPRCPISPSSIDLKYECLSDFSRDLEDNSKENLEHVTKDKVKLSSNQLSSNDNRKNKTVKNEISFSELIRCCCPCVGGMEKKLNFYEIAAEIEERRRREYHHEKRIKKEAVKVEKTWNETLFLAELPNELRSLFIQNTHIDSSHLKEQYTVNDRPYEKFVIINAFAKNQNERSVLQELHRLESENIIFLSNPTSEKVQIAIHQDELFKLRRLFSHFSIRATREAFSLQKYVDDSERMLTIDDIDWHSLQHPRMRRYISRDVKTESSTVPAFDVKDYQDKSQEMNHMPLAIVGSYVDYESIVKWAKLLEQKYPNIINMHKIGTSYEQRPIYLIRVGFPRDDIQKPVLLIEGTIHAREWISAATCTFIISQLVKDVKSNQDNQTFELLRNVDLMIIPVINPDGYEYTKEKRMWRKTRTPYFYGSSSCYGVDMNRNFEFHWMESGSSSNPCADTFAGRIPFSEPETRAISALLIREQYRIVVFVSLHSYSQLILLPWSYGKERPSDFRTLKYYANRMKDAIQKKSGIDYTVGASPDILYCASGNTADFAKGRANIKFAFTFELRDKSTFLLPSKYIIPVGEEILAALKILLYEIVAKEVKTKANPPLPKLTNEQLSDYFKQVVLSYSEKKIRGEGCTAFSENRNVIHQFLR